MAFTNYKALKEFVVTTLRWKALPRFAKEERYGAYRFKEFIYPWARFFFPRISRISITDEAFQKEFTREDYAKYPILLQEIADINKTNEEQSLLVNKANQQAVKEEALTRQTTAVGTLEKASTMSGPNRQPSTHSSLPPPPVTEEPAEFTKADEAAAVEEAQKIVTEKTPVPEAFNKAFDQEPEFKTNPSVAPKIPSGLISPLKNAASSSGIFFQRNIGKFLTPQTLATGATTVLGGIVGGGLTGGSPMGVFAGAVGGASVPSFIKSGAAGPILSKAGNGATNFLSNFSGNISGPRFNPRFRGSGALKGFGTGKKVALAFALFGLFFGLFLIAGVVSPDNTPTSEASPTTPADLASCKFTRGDRNPAALSYQSPKLLGYFQEAAKITTVPAVILASIARVESPSAVSLTDESLSSLGCPRSPTGALGLMQIQPPGTRGGFSQGVELGASFLGKSLDQLTEADFCDARTSIILSAGFILKKLQLGYGIGDGTKWDSSWNNNQEVIYKVASGYYGCLEYGGGDPTKCSGPYNYGADIWTSIQSCQPGPNIASSAIPSGVGGARIASVAKQIAQQLIHSTNPGMSGCNPGGTYGPSYHCWSGMTSYDQANDPDYLQCTEFVWAVFDKAGFGTQINEIRKGNAGDWPDAAKDSQSFIVFNDPNQLQPGDIISLGQGGIVSHVSVVIEKDANTIQVAQAATSAPIETNYIKDGTLIVPTAGASGARSGIRGFIRLKGG